MVYINQEEIIMLEKINIKDNLTQLCSDGAFVNSYVLEKDDYLVVFDTLIRPVDINELKTYTDSLNKPVRFIINTHWHSDHCYGNRKIAMDDTVIIAHRDFWTTISREKYVISNKRKRTINNNIIKKPTITFRESCELHEDMNLRIIHTPGHSPDSSSIYSDDRAFVICGDTVLNSCNEKYAIPYFYWGSLDNLVDSLTQLCSLNCGIYLTGHGYYVNKSKLESDMYYLKNLKEKFLNIVRNTKDRNFDVIKEILKKEIKPEDCLPDVGSDSFWVPRMHVLNMEKMLTEELHDK